MTALWRGARRGRVPPVSGPAARAVSEPVPSPAPPAPLTYRQTVVILAGLLLAFFLGALDQTSIATALPAIAGDLDGAEHLSWVFAGYLLTSTAATPIYGKLSDLYGRKLLLQAAFVIFLAASALSAMAGDMIELIACRALQGIGAGGLMSMAHATIADIISPRERGRYQPYIAGTYAVASALGPVVGGFFVDHLSWRWIFWINIPIALAALYLSQRTLQHLTVKRVRHRIDYPGAMLIVAAVGSLILALNIAGRSGRWLQPDVLGFAAGAVVLLLLCILRERMAQDPILPPRLFANHTFVVANIMNTLMSAHNFGLIILIPLYLQIQFRLPASEAGLLLIPLMFTGTGGAVICGLIVTRTGRYRLLPIVGFAFTTAGTALMIFVTPGTPLVWIAAAMAFAGMGGGFAGPVTMVSIQNSVEVRDLGTGTASISFFRSMGGAFGVALVSAVLIAQMNGLLLAQPGLAALGAEPGVAVIRGGAAALAPLPPAQQALAGSAGGTAFVWAFGVATLLSFLTLIAALFLRELPLKTTSGRIAAAQARRDEA